ncbi:MAG: copper amine oxidase N-terminal domain-containing protein [bacterium]|nr:copper amine oxidase N-terminal domain-containing protein [bacterium]
MTYRAPRLQTLILTAVIATMASGLFALARPIEIVVDGQHVHSDVPPVQGLSEKIYVPLRSVADALGAQTIVDGDAIAVVRGNQSLRLRVGDVHAHFNGMGFTLKHAPFRVRGRVMIGLKAMADAFGMRASYNARTARVDLVTPGIGAANPQPIPTPE